MTSPTSEHQLQAAFVTWCRAHVDTRARLLFHIPNGGARDSRTGGVMVALGARSGVPDLFLPVPVADHAGLWIELKWGSGTPSDPQKRWLRTLAAQGYAIALAWDLAASQAALTAYLSGDGASATTHALDRIGPGPTV